MTAGSRLSRPAARSPASARPARAACRATRRARSAGSSAAPIAAGGARHAPSPRPRLCGEFLQGQRAAARNGGAALARPRLSLRRALAGVVHRLEGAALDVDKKVAMVAFGLTRQLGLPSPCCLALANRATPIMALATPLANIAVMRH